ncbi:MAG: Bax inhibitor-1 family protein [Solirubrobacterales bacterium]|nr:Bax inhibitor-1 family protein [Solirubrobacterales bacterium]
MPTYQELGFGGGAALTGDRARSVFGQVMGLVAVTIGFTALGAYVGHGMQKGGFVFIILAFVCMFGMQFATRAGRQQLATGLLFGLGLCFGLFLSPVLVLYAQSDPGVVAEAAGTTALFTAGLGAFGYSTRRDLSGIARTAFWALLALIVFGLIASFVAIPHANLIYCVAGLVIFGAFTAFDFQRLSQNPSYQAAPLIACSIFLDILNVFMLLLNLFAGGSRN